MGKEIQTPYLCVKVKFIRKFLKYICIQEIVFPIFIMFSYLPFLILPIKNPSLLVKFLEAWGKFVVH